LRRAFCCEICVDAGVLSPKTADSDDCCA
jgi:hypothetical protein